MSLKGLKIVITRAIDQAEPFADLLTAHGAIPIRFPTIRIEAIVDNPALDSAFSAFDRFDWMVFTSVNAVRIMLSRQPWAIRREQNAVPRIAVVGSKTAEALRGYGWEPTVIAAESSGTALLVRLKEWITSGQRVLLLGAERPAVDLASALEGIGAVSVYVPLYRTLPTRPEPQAFAAFRAAEVITFLSPSAVAGFVGCFEEGLSDAVRGKLIACIGPTTADAAYQAGLGVQVVARTHTIEALIATLDDYVKDTV